MEETLLQPPVAEQQETKSNYLITAIAASLVLHVACTAFLLVVPQGSPGSRSVSYVELNLPHSKTPSMAAPSSRPAPAVPAVPQEAQATEKSLPERKPTEAAPQAAKEPPEQPPAAAASTEQPVASAFGLGLSRGYFKSIHDGESLRMDVREYYLAMLEGINKKWWMDRQFDKVRIEPVEVWITVARNGEVLETQLKRGSGNPAYDKAVLASLKAAGPLPPLPASYRDETFQAPLRLTPPLELMGW